MIVLPSVPLSAIFRPLYCLLAMRINKTNFIKLKNICSVKDTAKRGVGVGVSPRLRNT